MSSVHTPWTAEVFLGHLRAVGGQAYHHQHPFHVAMNAGTLGQEAIRGWVANRFYYQQCIPRKDATIVARLPHRELRRGWLHRVVDHDGTQGDEGGIAAWLRLGEACGLPAAELLAEHHLQPGVRFAVDAYLHLVQSEPWPVAVASSLTELFAPDLMARRLAAFQQHYTWVAPWGFDYFQRRLTQARVDSEEGLRITLEYCDTAALQRAAVAALRRKCEVLWAMLDAIQIRYAPELPFQSLPPFQAPA